MLGAPALTLTDYILIGVILAQMFLTWRVLLMSATVSSASADIATLTTEVSALHAAVTAAATGFATLAAQPARKRSDGTRLEEVT